MPGAEHLRDAAPLIELLHRQKKAGRYYAALCAAPAVVLAHHGLLPEGPATAHPAFVEQIGSRGTGDAPVVVNGNCITSRGPGTAIAFALKLVELLWDRDHAQTVAAPMVLLHPLV
jgi:4-methyl-5(b-hydroxyethyl)-thiazole monophosphate biosynthesis